MKLIIQIFLYTIFFLFFSFDPTLMEADIPKKEVDWSYLDPSSWDDRVIGLLLFTFGTYGLMLLATKGAFPALLGSINGNCNKDQEDVLAINYTITAPIKQTVKEEEEVKSTKVVPKEEISSLSVKSGSEEISKKTEDISSHKFDNLFRYILEYIENDKPIYNEEIYNEEIYNENPEPFKISKAHADSCLVAFKEGGKKIYANEKGTYTYNRLNSSEFGKLVDEVLLVNYFSNLKEHELENLSNEDILNELKAKRSFGIFTLYEDMRKKFAKEDESCITLEEFTEGTSFKEDEETMSSEIEIVAEDFGIKFVYDESDSAESDSSDAYDIEF